MAVLSAQFWCKNFWNRKLRYQSIHDVITDWWKAGFQTKALQICGIGEKLVFRKRLFKKFGNPGIVLKYNSNSKVCFYMKTLSLHQILQETWRISKALKNPKCVKSRNQLWDHIFRYFNWVFRQLVLLICRVTILNLHISNIHKQWYKINTFC